MTATTHPDAMKTTRPTIDTLGEIQARVLWLATRMIDSANHDRPASDGVKVGGHQASSASLVTVMTALWFAHMSPDDRISVKPHAAPVLHAINYLLGNLDQSYLTRLRSRGGLQAYPSRTKDPDPVDFSTGSVGLGAAAPLFAAVTRRYVDAHFGDRPRSRFISLIGDAELDEGNIWEAVADPATAGLDNVLWIVDFNRQSLDRVVPGVRIDQWTRQFEAAGWHVQTVKYGRRLSAAFGQPGGEALRSWMDNMPNEHYQSIFALAGPALRERFLDGAPQEVADAIAPLTDDAVRELVTDLGGHDFGSLLESFDRCDSARDRPSVVFAYTIKGWGLPLAGNPRNHSAMLSTDQIDQMRAGLGLTPEAEWDRLDPQTSAGAVVQQCAERMDRRRRRPRAVVTVPPRTGLRSSRPLSTQEAFGRILVDLSRMESVRPSLVTTAPDVATSTNLAGFLNRTGIFHHQHRRSWNDDKLLRWTEGPHGQHIELGISEMNLFLLLGQLGLAWDLSDQPLLPVGTVYDPFVLRGLDALIYATYSGARFVVAGTPSGVSLAPEGGAHQSTMTPSVGLELPGCTLLEPAFPAALDWLLCDALGRIATSPDGRFGRTGNPDTEGAYYVRLSTRPIDSSPFDEALARLGQGTLHRQVLDGAYRIVDATDAQVGGAPAVCLAASGAVMPEALAAAALLTQEGIAAHVVDVTSLDRLYCGWTAAVRAGVHSATRPSLPGAMRAAFPAGVPLVTVHDAASHAMAWLGAALQVPSVNLGVDSFGQSGSVAELYDLHGLTPDTLVNAALAVQSLLSEA